MTMMGLVSNFFVHCVDDVPGDDASIRVWFTDLDQQKTETTQFSWLSTSEKVRAARLKSPLARQRYVTSRVFTRRLLSDLTGILPENLEILADKCGKPYLNLPVAAHHLSSELVKVQHLTLRKRVLHCYSARLSCRCRHRGRESESGRLSN